MIDEKSPRALPREVPDYHSREAAHLRALAANATTWPLKARLLEKAEQHEQLAEEVNLTTATLDHEDGGDK
ncbi:MAG TPA: hypothetical protein VN083_05385 [Vicinamibacteria bacterium]|jgi:hypothetical protein|nr:hypothetical protein [Vicinamibacteria bacterium]